MNVIFWLIVYLISVSSLVLFFKCAYYYESNEICSYEAEMFKMRTLILDRIVSFQGKSGNLIYSKSMLGSFYRDSLYKEYILNEIKLNNLGFSNEELTNIKSKIIPGLEERVSILNHANYTFILVIVALGIVVGSIINYI